MTWLLSLVVSPFARLAAIGVAALTFVAAVYRKGAVDTRRKIENEAQADALRRVRNATDAGNAVDVSPGRLRDDDGYRRD